MFVFRPDFKLHMAYASPADKTLGAFKRATALCVDGAGRLLIYDQRTERVGAYQ